MDHFDKDESVSISFADAVEALTHIADLDLDNAAARPEPLPDRPVLRAVHLLHDRDTNATIQVVKNSFRVILKYLQGFYQKETGYILDARTVEGIKNIMVLVGEAAKKLDRYTQMIHGTRSGSVTELREYRQLQEFYQRRIARKIDEGVLGAWILQLTQPLKEAGDVSRIKARKSRAKKRTFIDLDAVKRDAEYELFYLRKEDGSHYYNPRLIRNLRLVCDFGEYFGELKKEDPLAQVHLWQDRIFQATASSILKSARYALDTYFRDAARYKDRELVVWLNKATTALILSASSQNLITQESGKSCTDYFADFQSFLRGALTCREYQRLVVYAPRKSNKVALALLELVHALCKGLYRDARSYSVLLPVIAETLEQMTSSSTASSGQNKEAGDSWLDRLGREYSEMVRRLKYHPNRIVESTLELLEEGAVGEFDPLLQHNVPSRSFDLVLEDYCATNMRLACPVRQEYISKALVNEEFKEWLRGQPEEDCVRGEAHLLVNLQDRTSWNEHARCKAIEEMPNREPFSKVLTTITLAVDTDFYHQRAPYQRVNQADLFIQQFIEHLKNEGSGYYFPASLRGVLFPTFIQGLVKGIHEVFFSGRNMLLQKERLDFIQITHLFIVLKAIDVVAPGSFSMVCKDGVDTGGSLSALLFAMLKMINSDHDLPEDIEALRLLLYAGPFVIRERLMLAERFQRCLSAMKAIALARSDQGSERLLAALAEKMGPLYQRQLWKAAPSLSMPQIMT